MGKTVSHLEATESPRGKFLENVGTRPSDASCLENLPGFISSFKAKNTKGLEPVWKIALLSKMF